MGFLNVLFTLSCACSPLCTGLLLVGAAEGLALQKIGNSGQNREVSMAPHDPSSWDHYSSCSPTIVHCTTQLCVGNSQGECLPGVHRACYFSIDYPDFTPN